mmetsp:Transcript_99394/g.320542  ORF Transcript_99394/g.320542 Transcript_99394/m.320542 type:complete len:244 (-) Transcript_99394:393-1124(-)
MAPAREARSHLPRSPGPGSATNSAAGGHLALAAPESAEEARGSCEELGIALVGGEGDGLTNGDLDHARGNAPVERRNALLLHDGAEALPRAGVLLGAGLVLSLDPRLHDVNGVVDGRAHATRDATSHGRLPELRRIGGDQGLHVAVDRETHAHTGGLPQAASADAGIEPREAVLCGHGAHRPWEARVAVEPGADVVLPEHLQTLCGRGPEEGLRKASTHAREEVDRGLWCPRRLERGLELLEG